MTAFDTCDERLEIQSSVDASWVALEGPAWSFGNLFVLWQEADVRGDDVPIPGVDGTLSFPYRRSASRRVLEGAITGEVDRLGAVNASFRTGLQVNHEYLRSHVEAPIQTNNGLRAARLYMPDGTIRTATVKIVPPIRIGPMFPVTPGGARWHTLTVDLWIKEGRFA